ncbi:DNA topoisomerase IB [Mycolicibacter sinensis]|jgi:DNA topoisomerase IB|uniref:DNA topoisomerase n=1 Tax=Mycolicibacter sinensis (strain JDM601) TaxID=875328 RepID=A0A1A2E7X1_MYCSD|nr:DNA topoisomerase IB [Mycolicibacter sinensis]OBG00594.1 DNA topoisomerase [Mycolicibacter sinensis]OBG08501.1 DNA topoisomerase [Mycolicibacter sinensis]
MRLRRSNIGAGGFRRIGRGRGFSYTDGQRPVDDPEVLARIKELAIPPAWRNVWICPYPNGHIQAVGTDAAGRRQYLYHQQWQDERAEEKYDRVLTLAKMLPQWRADVLVDLRGRGLKRDRVLAVAQQLIDRGYFRAGGEEYAQENGSFGLATLLRDHVRIRSGCVNFDYPAKSGVRRTVSVDDPLVVRAVRSLLRAPTDIPRLLVYRTPEGWCEVRADDLNERFRALTGEQFSVKDLRTWHGTVLAAESFAAAREPTSKTVRRREIAAVMRAVSEELGNTPAVARSSYVDPRVVEAYERGVTIRAALDRARKRAKTSGAGLVAEDATARLIRRIDRARR